MRFVVGFVLGVLLTIGAAYVHDSRATGPGSGTESHRMVNWDVVQRTFLALGAKLGAEWDRLTGPPHDKA
jgi:hypothetical protein